MARYDEQNCDDTIEARGKATIKAALGFVLSLAEICLLKVDIALEYLKKRPEFSVDYYDWLKENSRDI